MFKIRFYITLFLCIASFALSAQRSFVSSVINKVSLDSLLLTARQLSGDTSIVMNGITDTIKSRFSEDIGNEKAAKFIKQKLEYFGLNTFEQTYNINGKNIYAIQPGSVFPEQCYMICAHYDNIPNAPINYGADDNASGVALVLEAARVLSKYPLPYTIYYVLFDQEEQGLVGSDYFCNMHNIGAKPVLGTINLDMIAYDGNNDSVANIHIRSVGGDDVISNKFIEINNLYTTHLNLSIINPPSYLSDHASFWKYFMPAVMFIEDDKNDFNPFYHSLNDKISAFNNSYFYRMAKLAIGTIADFASDSLHVGLNEYTTSHNDISVYPNPLADEWITLSHIHEKAIHVKIINSTGVTFFEEDMITDNEQLQIKLSPTLSAGLYHLLLIKENSIQHKTLIKQ